MSQKKSLKDIQKKTLEKIVSLSLTEGFYLAGGTALTIRYAHRLSEDFDFFTFPSHNFNANVLLEKLRNTTAEIVSISDGTLIFFVEGVKFSFFNYPYPLLEEPELWKDLGVYIAKDRDILCMKAIAIAQRGSKKDFFDLWYLMNRNSISLHNLLEDLKKKYENYNLGIFLKSLTYFEDAEREKNPHIDPFWENIKKFMSLLIKSEYKLYDNPSP
ncbi:nucleotidyl transferase AbiEii/AbiGii toxin family protein [Pampinifervens florentissimum]|uniref:nucleotidyl transferase AbiEii/AbiGii toxin family protein n=1 Tax=Pampinifervens florentissimum TaxID=1632019 RepID=UPI0013B489AD|nr:nucleotidyl transferase AbiEii/AbiGii toxin family protein [Hydrogenobacter sp. T-8]QID32577.1 nucleotidyl transferase AbiEii/AbiGii toxin family protein [Hydrogenobacter sp. T-8]